jgi:hypothetical protein
MLIVNEVRMLVIYSQWVQVITAKTTRSFVASIIEGWDGIADQMEIYQTPWFNFVHILGQQGPLLCTLAEVELQGPFVKTRTPLSSIPRTTLEGSSELHKRKKRRHTA